MWNFVDISFYFSQYVRGLWLPFSQFIFDEQWSVHFLILSYAHRLCICFGKLMFLVLIHSAFLHIFCWVNSLALMQWYDCHSASEVYLTDIYNQNTTIKPWQCTVYPKKYAHGFVVLCSVVVMQSFIMNSHEVFIHIHQGCFAGTGAIVRLPQCQWSKPAGYGKTSQCITTTKHGKAKTVCIFLGIYCRKGMHKYQKYK